MSSLFQLNIIEWVYAGFSLRVVTPRDLKLVKNSWLNSIGPDQNKQSECHFFMGTKLQVLLYGSSRQKCFFFDEEY